MVIRGGSAGSASVVLFAWPAGLGDMAIGVTAPWVLSALLRRPGFAAGKSFVAWNVSGILDLTVAVSIGALVPLLAPNFYGVVSTAPMTQLPLVLVPTYLEPTFLILHLTALFQARRLGREATRLHAEVTDMPGTPLGGRTTALP